MRVSDNSLVDRLERTVLWKYDLLACQQNVVHFYEGPLKVYTIQTKVLEEGPAMIYHKDQDQATELELAESFILCRHLAYKTHINSFAVFVRGDDRFKIARRKFTDKESEKQMKMTRLESRMSLMIMQEKLCNVRSVICLNQSR